MKGLGRIQRRIATQAAKVFNTNEETKMRTSVSRYLSTPKNLISKCFEREVFDITTMWI